MATRKSPARATTSAKPAPGRRARTEAAPAPAEGPGRFPIVGLGASAGGLEAFEQFLHAMAPDSGMAFVLVQHLDPSHPSILTEILQRSTRMQVLEAQDQMAVQPDHVYVIPPNRDMVIFHGALQLSLPTEPRGQRMPIDAFMRSLAEDQGERAVGIVLSGTGTDGTLGLRAIFGAGGLCLVQEPGSARYDGMPSSAIQSGYASQVLAVDRMPQALRVGTRALAIRKAIVAPATAAAATVATAVSGLNLILMQLRTGTGHDFSQYKKSTIGRRIERRMAQHAIDDAQVYARFLREHPAELRALFRELLINVTSFFRDPLAFAALKSKILPALLAGKPPEHVVRIWVAGCATGEEAYSIAMVLREHLDQTRQPFAVQMYSTDLDDEAIAVARGGLYPPNIAQDVAPERLRRFFLKEDAGYRVRKEIREMVVFAVQSVIKDPPFTRLDLLSCRNLMIYLEPELQDRLVPVLHYALRPGGVLFLSPSESIGSHTDLFEPMDRKWKFYRSKATKASTREVLGGALPWSASPGAAGVPPRAAGGQGRATQLAELARRALLQSFAPAAAVTDAGGNILYLHGETGRYLRPPPGQPTHNILEMAREGLALDLREALHRAAGEGLPTLGRELRLRTDGETLPVSLSVRLLPNPDGTQDLLLVSFQDLPEPKPAPPERARRGAAGGPARRIQELERDLAQAKESMSAMLEEQQASNEELKSTNEELQSTNEELQSTNEELETSKEELQSVNEELVTVNSELQTKVELMAVMQDDMKNLLDNIRLGIIFLDRRLQVRRFTRDATRVYRLLASDVGRSLADMRCELQGHDLLADAQSVLDTLVPVEREVCTADGTWYLARVQPYRTTDNVIDGVVLTLADVTERVHALAAHKARDLAEAVIDTVQTPLAVLDGALRLVSANQAFYRAFGGTPQDLPGQPLFALAQGRWDVPQLHALLEPGGAAPQANLGFCELDQAGTDNGARRLRISARRITDRAVDAGLVLLAIELLDPLGQAPA